MSRGRYKEPDRRRNIDHVEPTIGELHDRKIKKLQKGSITAILDKYPTNKEGRNGDIYIAQIGQKSHLLYKSDDVWHTLSGTLLDSTDMSSSGGGSTTLPDFNAVGQDPFSHDSGWIDINNSSDTNTLGTTNNLKGVYRIHHRMGVNLFKAEVFCRFEAFSNGEIKNYTVNLNSSHSYPGPNANRCGYWIESIDPYNADLHVYPDGLSVLYSERFKDSNDNTSILLSSDDATTATNNNVASMEVRVFLYPIVGDKGKPPSLNFSKKNHKTFVNRKNKKVTGKSVVGNLGAAVDGTKNSSFKIDSDDTTNGITLKNDSGVLKVRDADDTGDARIVTEGLEIAPESTTASIKLDGTNHKYITMQSAIDNNVGMQLHINAGQPDNGGSATADRTGGHLYLKAGKGTGTACGGDIIFQTADPGGSSNNTLNSLHSNARFNGDNGNLELEESLLFTATSGEETTLSVADTSGIFTIASTASTPADADIVLDAGGDINLNADSGKIYIKDSLAQHALFEGSTLKFLDPADVADSFKIATTTHGATSLTTVDAAANAAHINIVADGAVSLDTTTKEINFRSGLQQLASIAENSFKIYDDADDDDNFEITMAAGGETTFKTNTDSGAPNIKYRPVGKNIFKAGVGGPYIFELGAAGADELGCGQVCVKDDTPNNLYFTDDTGQDVQITNNGSLAGGSATSYWNQMVPGYKLNFANNSTYYTFGRMWNESWFNSDTDPSTISRADSFSAFFIAPRAGTITNVKIQGTSGDTGFDDPFKFYFYKAALNSDASTMSLTSMFATSSITPPTINETWSHTEDFSSSNTFAEDDLLYVWIKKDSHSANQDLYWLINVNGEYS